MKRSFAAAADDDDDDDAPPPFPATFKLYMSLPLLEFIFEWRAEGVLSAVLFVR